MGKIDKGRLSGLDGMRRHTVEELYAYVKDLEAQIEDPLNRDDPRWLRDWADSIRQLADEKLTAREHKELQGKRRAGDPDNKESS
jgi:hypothetical protein